MKELSKFVKDEFIKNSLFEQGVYVDTIDKVNNLVYEISCGRYVNLIFQNSSLKDYFFDRLYCVRPEMNVINCNCSLDRFNENTFDGLLLFDNVKKCRYTEIIEQIKTHKGILIC